ncbi:MAG TPA: hypothetical protein VLE19_05035, partial [Pyrinomonadaceae bacterium]|nr:hypothetical protein [Pyrinomonadaceae bacterium]
MVVRIGVLGFELIIQQRPGARDRALSVQSANRQQPAFLQEYSIPRERMVARLREHYGIKSQSVLEAMR